jgi:hypothetical protein
MAKSKEKVWVKTFIITTFVGLYAVVSLISTIHVIDFFKLSNDEWLAISLAIGFEIGAAASLASIIALDKMNKSIVWSLFFTLTAMQAMGNTYYAYSHLKNFTQWSELFGLIEEDIIYQKRVLSIISGAILPLVALGFVKSLVDYIRPPEEEMIAPSSDDIENEEIIIDDKVGLTPETIEQVKSHVTDIKLEEVKDMPNDGISIPVDDPIQQDIEEKIEVPKDQNIIKEKTAKIIQIGYKADFPEEAIDLGSSQPIEDETPVITDNKNSNWHRVFNNELSPENLK